MKVFLLTGFILLSAEGLYAEQSAGSPETAVSGPAVSASSTDSEAADEKSASQPREEPVPETPKFSLYDQFFRGGFWMWPILGCSFIGVAFALERLLNMRRPSVIPPELVKEMNGSITPDSVGKIRELCKKHPSCFSRVLLAGLERADLPLAEMERAVDEKCSRELYDLRKNIRPLGIVATVAPMFGLLGTVSGMISAFDVVASHGALGDPKLLSGSIAVALLTTGFGLIVAIPALMLHHYLRGRAENLMVEISDIADHVLVKVESKTGGRPPSPASSSGLRPAAGSN